MMEESLTAKDSAVSFLRNGVYLYLSTLPADKTILHGNGPTLQMVGNKYLVDSQSGSR